MSEPQGLADWEKELCRIKARKAAKKFKLTREDTQDLEQELLVHLFIKRQDKDYWKFLRVTEETMATHIVNNKVVDFLRSRHTKRESVITKAASLSKPDEEGSIQPEPSYTEPYERTREEHAALHEKMERALQGFKGVRKDIARLLMEGKRISEVVVLLNLHRTTVQRERADIKKHFLRLRLDKFL